MRKTIEIICSASTNSSKHRQRMEVCHLNMLLGVALEAYQKVSDPDLFSGVKMGKPFKNDLEGCPLYILSKHR